MSNFKISVGLAVLFTSLSVWAAEWDPNTPSCDAFLKPYGTYFARCKVLKDGRVDSKSKFLVLQADLCLMKRREAFSEKGSGPVENVDTYVIGGDFVTQYLGKSRSKDSLLQGGPGLSYEPQEIVEERAFLMTASSKTDGSRYNVGDSYAEVKNSSLYSQSAHVDGFYPDYHWYRQKAKYDLNTHQLELTYQRDLGWLFFRNWKTMLQIKMECEEVK